MQKCNHQQLEDQFVGLIKSGQKSTIINGYEIIIPKIEGWSVKRGNKVLDGEREGRVKAQLLLKQLLDVGVIR
jgi:hypothetical protein